MVRSRAIAFYLLMLLAYVAHVFEEVWGHFFMLDVLPGLGVFLAVNWALLCVPVLLFYFFLRGRRWATTLSMVYAGVMVVNGLGHNVATLVTGRYFGGFAGGYSGLALVLVGVALLTTLRKVAREDAAAPSTDRRHAP